MIVVFDLDDTLYPELSYVEGGFRAVARELERRWGIDPDEAVATMLESLHADGRGTQFEAVVERFGLTGRQSIRRLVSVYRHHEPRIALPAASRGVLERLRDRPLYLVTDGHKVVQANKVDALGIRGYFRHCYLTHRYGIAHRKPSPRVFRLIAARERCAPGDVVYVADDPSKDFRGIRPLGFRTIRVRTGWHADAVAPEAEDAEHAVRRLEDAVGVIERMEG